MGAGRRLVHGGIRGTIRKGRSSWSVEDGRCVVGVVEAADRQGASASRVDGDGLAENDGGTGHGV